jgi:hypothetical protein
MFFFFFVVFLCALGVRENFPAVGILGTASAGYTICECFLDERRVLISERLTEDVSLRIEFRL